LINVASGKIVRLRRNNMANEAAHKLERNREEEQKKFLEKRFEEYLETANKMAQDSDKQRRDQEYREETERLMKLYSFWK
jgi:hypothetical protein